MKASSWKRITIENGMCKVVSERSRSHLGGSWERLTRECRSFSLEARCVLAAMREKEREAGAEIERDEVRGHKKKRKGRDNPTEQ